MRINRISVLSAALLATTATIVLADAKIYPATFCQPINRQHNFCLNSSRFGFVVNDCAYDVKVVCPLIRDVHDSTERFDRLTLWYDTDEDFNCSFKTTRLSLDTGLSRQLGECDFSVPKDETVWGVRRNHPSEFRCQSNQMPDTVKSSAFSWDSNNHHGYTLTCRLPSGTRLGHYSIKEPSK